MIKKKIIIVLLVFIMILNLNSCTKTEQINWKDYFEVSYERIPESKFDNSTDELNALLNGTYIFEHDEYIIKNKTNHILDSVYAVFKVTPKIDQEFEFKVILGGQPSPGVLKQGQTDVLELSDAYIKEELREEGYSQDQGFEVLLVRIEFKIKQ